MLSPTRHTLLGKRYILQYELGHGGMGIVHRALDRLTGQQVALKRVTTSTDHSVFSSHDSAMDLRVTLAREFQMLSSLRHPHIISVLDYGFDAERQPYFTMELIENAQTVIEAGQHLSSSERIRLLAQILQALVYLHRRGIVHRDLKPRNVLATADTQVKVLDFGLSIMHKQADEQAGTTAGTLAYLSPEVFQGAPASESSDLYAVGIIGYELLTGHHPFDVENIGKLTNDILYTIPALPTDGIDATLAPILARLLAKSVNDRYQDASEVIKDLSQVTQQTLSVETAAIRESFLQSARLVERDDQIAELTAVFNAARKGQGNAWLIGVESGVGKSRLINEIRTLALVQGALVLRGQTVSEGATLYQIWRDALRWICLIDDHLTDLEAGVLKVLVPDIASLVERPVPDAPELDPQSTQQRLLTIIEEIFRRQKQTTVIILEDLHWAGSESLAVLERLSKIAHELPLLIIGSYRDDETPKLPDQLGIKTLKLTRLSDKGIVELSESMLGPAGRQPKVVQLLQKETEGNAFFLVEVVRALAEEVGQLDKIGTTTLPAHVFAGGVQRIVQRRLNRIPEQDRGLLQAAAVFGRQLDISVLHLLFPDRNLDQWLTVCDNAVVLDLSEGQWRFAHDKLREGVFNELSDEQRRQLHREIAGVMEKLYANDDKQTEALALHCLNGQIWDKASEYLIKAGNNATRLYAHTEARTHYQQALDALSHLPDTEEWQRRRIDTTIRLVSISFGADSPEHNLARLAEVEPLAQALPASDRLLLARVHYWMGRSHYYRAETRQAIGYYQKVLTVAKEFNDAELLAMPSNVIGQALIIQGHFKRAEALLAQAIGPLEMLANWPEWIRAVSFHGLSLAAIGQFTEALVEGKRALARGLEMNYLTGIGTAHLLLWLINHMGGDVERMVEESQAVLDTAEQNGDKLYIYFGTGFRAWSQSRIGNHLAAQQGIEQTKELGKAIGGQLVLADWFTVAEAEIALNAGRMDDALRLAEAAVVACKPISVYSDAMAQRAWARALKIQQHFEEAEAHIALSLTGMETSEARIEAARVHYEWGLISQARNDEKNALDHFQKAADLFAASGLTRDVEQAQAKVQALK